MMVEQTLVPDQWNTPIWGGHLRPVIGATVRDTRTRSVDRYEPFPRGVVAASAQSSARAFPT